MNTRPHSSSGRCAAMFVAVNCVLFSLGVSVGTADPAASPAGYRPAIDPAGFSVVINHPYFTPAGDFTNCVKTKDWSAIEPNSVEHKYYSKEIGNVVLETEGRDRQRVELIEVTTAPQSNTPDTK